MVVGIKHSVLILVLSWLLSGCHSLKPLVNESQSPQIIYPAAPASGLVENIHGTEVADPYRSLEENNTATQKWVREQQAFGQEYLASIPGKHAVAERITELWNYEKISAPFESGRNQFYYRNDGLQSQSVLYVKGRDGQERALLDPNKFSTDGTVALSGVSVSNDGNILAYGISKSGSDWQQWQFMDVSSGKLLKDKLEWIKFSSANWDHDSQGVYYSRYDAPEGGDLLSGVNFNQKIYYHKLGTEQSQDRLIYQRLENKDWGFDARETEDGKYLLISVSQGTDSRNRFFYQPLTNKNMQIVELIADLEAEYSFIGNEDNIFYFKTDLDAPKGKIIAIDVNKPAKRHWETIIPESEDTISAVSMINDHLVVSYLRDVLGKMSIYSMGGVKRKDVSLPGKGKVAGPYGKNSKDYFYRTYALTNIKVGC